MQIFASICAGVVAGYLAFAALAKVFSLSATLKGFEENKWKPAWLFLAGSVVAELAAAIAIFVWPKQGAIIPVCLFAVYCVIHLVLLARRSSMNCWCYGSASESTLTNLYVLALMLAASIVAVGKYDHNILATSISAAVIFVSLPIILT